MRPTRNWTTYVPESESALRKKCIELSPTFPLSSTSNASAVGRCNLGHTHQTKDAEWNSVKTNLRKSCDSVNDNDAIFTLSSSTKIGDTTAKPSFDKDFENSTTTNSTDIDVDCDKSVVNLERAPLIQLSPNKSITLVKQNSTSLIFTKKDVNPVVHRKRITLVHSNGSHSTSDITTTTANAATAITPAEGIPIVSHTDESILSPRKRHSFHWNTDRNSCISPSDKLNRKQIKSWYAVIGASAGKDTPFVSDSEVGAQSPSCPVA